LSKMVFTRLGCDSYCFHHYQAQAYADTDANDPDYTNADSDDNADRHSNCNADGNTDSDANTADDAYADTSAGSTGTDDDPAIRYRFGIDRHGCTPPVWQKGQARGRGRGRKITIPAC